MKILCNQKEYSSAADLWEQKAQEAAEKKVKLIIRSGVYALIGFALIAIAKGQ